MVDNEAASFAALRVTAQSGLTPLWVICGLAMGPAVALGLARFAYALLLPAMRADLGWSFAAAGAMNTANAVGYLAGALAAAPLGRRIGDDTTFALGLLLTALVVGASGLTVSFGALLVLRLVAGLTGALALICGAGLTSAAATGGSASRAPTLLGLYFAGAGIGVTASALAVPPLSAAMGWRAARPHAWTAAIGALTVAFGLGQCIGPVLSGALSDGPSGVRAGLWLSAGILVFATIAATFQHEPVVEH